MKASVVPGSSTLDNTFAYQENVIVSSLLDAFELIFAAEIEMEPSAVYACDC